jgi:superfamily II DNA or RNA helicase
VRDEFIARGIRAEHIDGTTPTPDRAATLAALEAGHIQVVTNCSVLVEGLDITSISAISLAVPTRSLSKYLQMVGRAARPHEGKTDYVILDHGGCVLRHGTPDYEQTWDIRTRKRGVKAEKGMIMARVCGECMYANPPGEEECLQCGETLKVERTIDERGGTLIEIKSKQAPVSRAKYLRMQAERRSSAESFWGRQRRAM